MSKLFVILTRNQQIKEKTTLVFYITLKIVHREQICRKKWKRKIEEDTSEEIEERVSQEQIKEDNVNPDDEATCKDKFLL